MPFQKSDTCVFSAPFCPTCNRELARKGEAEEVIKGLEEQTRAIPAKVHRLEAMVAGCTASGRTSRC